MSAFEHGSGRQLVDPCDTIQDLGRRQPGRVSLGTWHIGKTPLWQQSHELFTEGDAAQKDLPRNLPPWRRSTNSVGYKLTIRRPSPRRVRIKQRQDVVDRQPGRDWSLPCGSPVTAPRPGLWSRHQAGSHRIKHEIPTELQQVALTFHDNTLEPTLQDMADPTMPPIEVLRVPTVQPSHAETERRFGRLEQQMVMIFHQTVGITPPVLLQHFLAEEAEKLLTVGVIKHDRLPRVSSRRDMMEPTRKIES